jgi:hypothetical protein
MSLTTRLVKVGCLLVISMCLCTRANFVIGLCAVKFARKKTRIIIIIIIVVVVVVAIIIIIIIIIITCLH